MRPRIVQKNVATIAAGSLLVALALVPAASAQGGNGTDPDLGSGWVLRASVETGEPPHGHTKLLHF